MSALQEAVKVERQTLKERREEFIAAYERAVAKLDEVEQIADQLATALPESVAARRSDAKRTDASPKAARPSTRRGDQKIRRRRKEAILECLRAAHPVATPAGILREATGVKAPATLRSLIEELIGAEEVEKIGTGAGTRYQLATGSKPSAPKPPPVEASPTAGDPEAALSDQILAVLKGGPRSHGQLVMSTTGDSSAVRGATASLRVKGAIRLRRVDGAELWEAAK